MVAFVDMNQHEPTKRLISTTAGSSCDKRRVLATKISYDGEVWDLILALRQMVTAGTQFTV